MNTTSTTNAFDEEWVCVDSLCHYLKQNLGYQDIQVKRESDDPPDFWVTISGEKFAAEVTSIVSNQAYHGLCKNLETAILQQAKSNNCLKGKYALIIKKRPEIPKRASKQWQKLVHEATRFIAATMNFTSSNEEIIYKNDYGSLVLQKISNVDASISIAGPVISRWEGEAEAELLLLIQQAIDRKRTSLEKKRIPTKCPNIILLLYDAYGFCDISDVYQILRKSRGYEWFHSIYWAASFTDRPNDLAPDNPGRLGDFLYSKKVEWCRKVE